MNGDKLIRNSNFYNPFHIWAFYGIRVILYTKLFATVSPRTSS